MLILYILLITSAPHRVNIRNVGSNMYLQRSNDTINLVQSNEEPKTDFFVFYQKNNDKRELEIYEKIKNKPARYLSFNDNKLEFSLKPYFFEFERDSNFIVLKTYEGKCLTVEASIIGVTSCDSSENQKFVFEKFSLHRKMDKNSLQIDIARKDDKNNHEDIINIKPVLIDDPKYHSHEPVDDFLVNSHLEKHQSTRTMKVVDEDITDIKTTTRYKTLIINTTSTVIMTSYTTYTSTIIKPTSTYLTISENNSRSTWDYKHDYHIPNSTKIQDTENECDDLTEEECKELKEKKRHKKNFLFFKKNKHQDSSQDNSDEHSLLKAAEDIKSAIFDNSDSVDSNILKRGIFPNLKKNKWKSIFKPKRRKSTSRIYNSRPTWSTKYSSSVIKNSQQIFSTKKSSFFPISTTRSRINFIPITRNNQNDTEHEIEPKVSLSTNSSSPPDISQIMQSNNSLPGLDSTKLFNFLEASNAYNISEEIPFTSLTEMFDKNVGHEIPDSKNNTSNRINDNNGIRNLPTNINYKSTNQFNKSVNSVSCTQNNPSTVISNQSASGGLLLDSSFDEFHRADNEAAKCVGLLCEIELTL